LKRGGKEEYRTIKAMTIKAYWIIADMYYVSLTLLKYNANPGANLQRKNTHDPDSLDFRGISSSRSFDS
jgi:hypothetical protein